MEGIVCSWGVAHNSQRQLVLQAPAHGLLHVEPSGLGRYVQRRLWWTSAQSERAQNEHDRRRQEQAERAGRAGRARREAADRRAARQQQELQRRQQLQRRRTSQPVPDPEDEETRRAQAQEQRRLEQAWR
ncbi:hypothetical protein ACWDV7_33815 [Streptomyces sp. NPDC003362]